MQQNYLNWPHLPRLQSITNRSAAQPVVQISKRHLNYIWVLTKKLHLKSKSMLPLLLLAAGGCHAQPVESNLIIPSLSSSSSSSPSPSPLAMAANCSQTRQDFYTLTFCIKSAYLLCVLYNVCFGGECG